MPGNYVLITAARNEEKHIAKTIESVIGQTHKPIKWIIVSDRSTDRTDEIVRRYANENKFIELLSIIGDEKRNFGSQVRAINKGYEKLRQPDSDYSFIGNLDADVSFRSDYFEKLLAEFEKNPKLGLGGGFICEEKRGVFVSRDTNSEKSVAHAVQLFRRECFESIGGYLPLKYGGPDWCAEIMVSMRKWDVFSFPKLEVNHHRPTTSAEGFLRGAFRSGLMDYSMGSHPIFEIIKCFRRLMNRPIILGASFRIIGYLYGLIKNEPRQVPAEVTKYLRSMQINRLLSIFLIK